MVETLTIDVTPLRKTIGKLLPMDAGGVSFFLLENFKKKGMSTVIDEFYSIVDKEIPLGVPIVERVINLLLILDRVLSRNVPSKLQNLLDIRVTKLIKSSTMLKIDVDYVFE